MGVGAKRAKRSIVAGGYMADRLARFAAVYVAVDVAREAERLRKAAEQLGVSYETAAEYLRHPYVQELVTGMLEDVIAAARLTRERHALRLHEVADAAQAAADFGPAVAALKGSAQVLGHLKEQPSAAAVAVAGTLVVIPGRDAADLELDREGAGGIAPALGRGVRITSDEAATAHDEAAADSPDGG